MQENKIAGVYHPRVPKESPLWHLLESHFHDSEQDYVDKFVRNYGFYRRGVSKEIDDWQMYLSDSDMDIDELRLNTRTGRPIGKEGFIQRAEKIAGRILRPGKAGRPRINSYYVTRFKY